MRRHAAVLLVFASVGALPAQAGERPASRALTPAGEEGLGRLAEKIRRGELGREITGVTLEAHESAIELRIEGDEHRWLTLHRPPHPLAGGAPRHFIVVPHEASSRLLVPRLAALLDQVFPENPWSEGAAPTAENPGPGEALPEEHGSPGGPWRTALAIVLLAASWLMGFLYLASTRPTTTETGHSRE